MKTFNRLINFLYREDEKYEMPRIIVKEKFAIWLPGKSTTIDRRKLAHQLLRNPGRISLIGVSPSQFRAWNNTPENLRDSIITWGFLDVDDFENEGEALKFSRRLACIDFPFTHHLSKSKRGLHLFFRYEKMVSKNVVKEFQKSLGEMIEEFIIDEDFSCSLCGATRANAWVGGAKYHGRLLHINKNYCDSYYEKFEADYRGIKNSSSIDFDSTELKIDGLKKEMLGLIADAIMSDFEENSDGSYRANIHVKAAFEALKGTRFEFETKSKMRSIVPKINGFILVRKNILHLIPNADNRAKLIVDGNFVSRIK